MFKTTNLDIVVYCELIAVSLDNVKTTNLDIVVYCELIAASLNKCLKQ